MLRLGPGPGDLGQRDAVLGGAADPHVPVVELELADRPGQQAARGAQDRLPEIRRGIPDRVADEERHPAAHRRSGVRAGRGVSRVDRHALERHAELLGGDQAHGGGGPLAEVHGPGPQRDRPVRQEIQRGSPRAPPDREGRVLAGNRAAATAADAVPDRGHTHSASPRARPRRRPGAALARLEPVWPDGLDGRGVGRVALEDLPRQEPVALPEAVPQAELERIQAQLRGQLVHLRLDGERDLRRARAAHAAGRGVVREDHPAVQLDVRPAVGTGRRGERLDHEPGSERGVRPGVGKHVDLEGGERRRRAWRRSGTGSGTGAASSSTRRTRPGCRRSGPAGPSARWPAPPGTGTRSRSSRRTRPRPRWGRRGRARPAGPASSRSRPAGSGSTASPSARRASRPPRRPARPPARGRRARSTGSCRCSPPRRRRGRTLPRCRPTAASARPAGCRRDGSAVRRPRARRRG